MTIDAAPPRPRRARTALRALLFVAAALLVLASTPWGTKAWRRWRYEGERAPAWSIPAYGGGRLDSATLAGRVAVLDFWASWCAPCRAQMPELDRLAAEPAMGEVAFVSINLDEPGPERAARVATFARRYRALRHAVDDGAAERAYGVSTLPTLVVVRPDGSVSALRTGALSADAVRALVDDAR